MQLTMYNIIYSIIIILSICGSIFMLFNMQLASYMIIYFFLLTIVFCITVVKDKNDDIKEI